MTDFREILGQALRKATVGEPKDPNLSWGALPAWTQEDYFMRGDRLVEILGRHGYSIVQTSDNQPYVVPDGRVVEQVADALDPRLLRSIVKAGPKYRIEVYDNGARTTEVRDEFTLGEALDAAVGVFTRSPDLMKKAGVGTRLAALCLILKERS